MNIHVFSYGSNMCPARLTQRVPGATFVTTGYVAQRRIALHKRSQDGSAKADALFTGNDADHVWGVVYAIDKEQKPRLDACEFLGVGYDEKQATVYTSAGERLACWIYVARSAAIDESLLPYEWYKALVLHGARQHDLPPDYVEMINALSAMPDPDARRRERHQRLLDE